MSMSNSRPGSLNEQVIPIARQAAKLRGSLGEKQADDTVNGLKTLESSLTEISEILIPFEQRYTALEAMVRTLEGVSAVLVAKVGHCPRGEMQMAGIEVCEDYAFEYVEASLIAYYGRRRAEAAGERARAGAA